jgi:hypothetical protein
MGGRPPLLVWLLSKPLTMFTNACQFTKVDTVASVASALLVFFTTTET